MKKNILQTFVTPRLSVIIPVYNAERYLQECLNSVLQQVEMLDIEVIAVDDGSFDSSPTILSDWARRDTRIKVITQKNQGPGIARNIAISMARGSYVCFLDADDRITSGNALYTAYQRANQEKLDILFCSFNSIDNNGVVRLSGVGLSSVAYLLPSVFSPVDARASLFSVASTAAWAKLFRRDFLLETHLVFPPFRRTEDFPFVQLAEAMAKRMGVLAMPIIDYRDSVVGSLENTKDEMPLAFAESEDYFQLALTRLGLADRFNLAARVARIGNAVYALKTVRRFSSFCTVVQEIARRREDWILLASDIPYDVIATQMQLLQKIVEANSLSSVARQDSLINIFIELHVSNRLSRELVTQTMAIASKDRVIATKDEALVAKDSALTQLRHVVEQLHNTVCQCQDGLVAKDRAIAAKDEALVAKDSALTQLRHVAEQLRNTVCQCQDGLAAKDMAIATKDEALVAKDSALTQLRHVAEQLRNTVCQCQDGLAAKDMAIATKDEALVAKDAALTQLRHVAEQLRNTVCQCQDGLAAKDRAIAAKDETLKIQKSSLSFLRDDNKIKQHKLLQFQEVLRALKGVLNS